MPNLNAKPSYPGKAEALYAFCVDGLTDTNAMIRRLNEAAKYDGELSPALVAEVREAIWDRAYNRSPDGTIGRPPSSWIGLVNPVRRRSI